MAANSEKEQMMFSMIESWKDSGKSQQDFCKEQGIAYGDFHYWYKKYREAYAIPSSAAFVQVPMLTSSSGLLVAELILTDGRRVNFYQGVDVSLLRSLLS